MKDDFNENKGDGVYDENTTAFASKIQKMVSGVSSNSNICNNTVSPYDYVISWGRMIDYLETLSTYEKEMSQFFDFPDDAQRPSAVLKHQLEEKDITDSNFIDRWRDSVIEKINLLSCLDDVKSADKINPYTNYDSIYITESSFVELSNSNAIKIEDTLKLLNLMYLDKWRDIVSEGLNKCNNIDDIRTFDPQISYSLSVYEFYAEDSEHELNILSVTNKKRFEDNLCTLKLAYSAALKHLNSMSVSYDSMSGSEFEHFCAELLKNNGYTNVEVTSGSGDYGVDILAEKDAITYAIQCKRSSSTVGNKAIQEIYSGRTFYKRHIGVVMTNNYFTPAAIETSEKTGVVLWDRNKIDDMLNAEAGVSCDITKPEDDFASLKEYYSKQSGVKKNGTVKWYNIEEGYGFIVIPGEKDAFVHSSAIMTDAGTLKEGQKVQFEVIQGEHGPMAIKVMGRKGFLGLF